MKSDYMQLVKKYAESFMKKDKKEGILFYGGVGIGKTFVSACGQESEWLEGRKNI
ncbi:hypothetical protein [Fusobacterium sp.]|uniref:hypothetical protein n=1 Tax=Fusobacterium sp. TaxID=68766 RepID=UPI0028FE4ECD|nr:hypothetical protein [Fusobacterium sp.]MDU1911991.1 hypothetical protein [Fusobacterium sp.]